MGDEESTPIDRLYGVLKSPYKKDGEVIEALFQSFAAEFEDYEETLDTVVENKFIDTASSAQLDKLASLFDTNQRAGESVEAFRARLKVNLRSQISSATVDEIREIVSVILGVDESEIEIVEPFELEPAFIELSLPTGFSDTIAPTELVGIVQNVTAAGVDVGIRVTTTSDSVLVFTDEFVIGPFDDNIYRDVVRFRDTSRVDPVGGMDTSETLFFTDEGRSRTDADEAVHWNEGKWGINYWNDFEQLPDERSVDSVVFGDNTRAEPLSDLYRQNVVGVSEAIRVGPLADLYIGNSVVVSDAGSVRKPTNAEEGVVSDAVTLTPQPTEEYYWNEGIWEFGVWSTES